MESARASFKSMKSKIKDVKDKPQGSPEAQPMRVQSGPVGHPQLSAYILTRALKRPEGVSFTDLARALLDAKNRAGDKAYRSQLPALLLRLSFYENVPSDVVARLAPLFPAYAKDPKVVRSLFYMCAAHVTRGSAGTPTLLDPAAAAAAGRPDAASLQAVFVEGQRLLQAGEGDPAVRRAAAYLLAAAGRSNDHARREAAAALERAVTANDALASAASPAKGKAAAAVPSSSNWELQHTVFGAFRLSDAAAAGTDLGRAAFQGVGSPDPAGARHALALVAELALREPALVLGELAAPVAAAAVRYEAQGPCQPAAAGEGINTEDAFARAALARACAAVLHSDQGASDPGRGGAPFWHMLCLLATRDPSDLVRFAALEAMTGAAAGPGAGALARPRGAAADGKASAREATVAQQRRARAWRTLVAYADTPVSIPGVGDAEGAAAPAPPALKLIDVVARLLLLALSKSDAAARFCAAAAVASSLAESCLASQAVGTTRHATSPDVDRALGILARALGGLVESPLRPAQRCACVEALLYLQAAGHATGLTPAKLAAVGGRGGGGGGGAASDGVQDALLTAVLKCARARPKDAASFLSYASGVVGIAPAGVDLKKVSELWDAAAAAGREGRAAALAAALEALRAPAPPATRPAAGAGRAAVVRAAREEAGWNGFVATAAWWLGEHANALCDEFAGRKVPPAAAGAADAAGAPSPADAGDYADGTDTDTDSEAAVPLENGSGDGGAAAPDAAAVLARQAARNPALSRVIAVLHDAALTAAWQLRAASARALAKVAVRSGEPFRLQCYGILAAAATSGGAENDALGLQGVVAPALALLDRLYATQATLDGLWAAHGDDIDGWPPEVVTSLARRAGELRGAAERTVCSVPRERYALLGPRAVAVLGAAAAEGAEAPAYAAFLQSEVAKAEKAAGRGARDAVGATLATAKNKEVEDILSFGGSDAASASFQGFLAADGGAGRASDRDAEIESMLSGGGSAAAADAWAFGAPVGGAAPAAAAVAEEPSFNAFAEYSTAPASVSPGPSSPGPAASPPRSDWEPFAPEPAAAAVSPRAEPHGAGGTARVLGSGVMAHTFIADPSNPEELSIFEGDGVEVVEEADGWMLVRDPSGSQGLVPTAYVRLERLVGGGTGSGGAGGDVWGALARGGGGAVSPPAGHSRGMSGDYTTTSPGAGATNEDFLDRFFSSGGAAAAPAAAAAAPAPQRSAWEDFGAPAAAASPRQLSPHASGSPGAGAGPSRPSPEWASPAGGAASPGAGSAAGNPFTAHRRAPSGASSHQRTLSGGSDAWGSMPTTPGRIEGPERAVAAAFQAELEGELSVEPGDRVKVHSEVGGWARVMRLSDARAGLVPSWAVGEA